ncbi:MAG: GAF domain-containing protein [Candidatus Cloacimonetes bacterium]|nr:GAF domain-containing protein [Candidatus Cloacimonadota bacterium]
MSQDKLIVISDIAAENLVELGIPRANCLSLSQFLEGTKKNSMPHLFILESAQLAQKDVLDAISKVPFHAVALTYEEELFMQPMVADDIISHFLPKPVNSKILRSVISSVLESVSKDQKIVEIEQKLKQESRKLKELNEIGKSLSSIADPYILMNLILRKSRELTNADAGSVCVIKYDNEGKPSRLLFSYFQNETLKQDAKVNLDLPVSKSSLAGYVAITGECLQIEDAYEIQPDKEYSFNSNVDKSTGYRTKSMLVHPMVDNEAKILGIVQLLNKKSWSYQPLENGKLNIDLVESFNEEDVEIISSLTSQAAICLKNTTLIQDIQNLFEGFVNASVTAIEQRDPTTSGHSFRVALMTCELAKACAKVKEGPYAGLLYSERELQEIRYASLLHDFGKIGVREQVLVKAKKLYPYEMDLIRARFEYILKEAEAAAFTKKSDMVKSMGYDMASAHFYEVESELASTISSIEDILYFIMQTNEPTVLEEGNFQRLLEIAERNFLDPYGNPKPFLTEREVEALSIRRGSITADERKEIESHVTHSFTFLSKIPWTPGLKQVPSIAYGHHEWLSGDGYPNQLSEEEILSQSKMMAIADIYDALTASDRPYKKAIPVEKALAILKMEVDRKHLDGNLVNHFIDFDVFKVSENL